MSSPTEAALARVAQNGDRARAQDVLDRSHRGCPVPLLHPFQILRSRCELQCDPYDARVQEGMLLEAGGPKDVEHPVVLRKRVGDKAPDPALPGSRGKMLQENGAQTAALVVVTHNEGDLRLVATTLR